MDYKDILEVNSKTVATILKWNHAVIQGEMTLDELMDTLNGADLTISPEDYAYAAQEVVVSGVPNEDYIAKGMELFLAYDRYIKNNRKIPKLSQDHPLVLYHQENQEMRRHLSEGLEMMDQPFDLATWQSYAALLESYRIHYIRKQNQLYPRLESRAFTYPTRIDWHYDDEAASLLTALRQNSEQGQEKAIKSSFLAAREAVLQIMLEEERILFPIAFRLIALNTFLKMELGDAEIGYAFIEGPSYNQEEIVMMKGLESLMRQHDGQTPDDFMIPMKQGKLSLTQLNLLMRHLPFDISFIDSEDVVRYFNERPDRIFLRSPGAIGRDVKNCHPRESLKMVTTVIEALREGKKDKAIFWVHYHDRLIYIQYIAVRDSRHRFAGIIELAQDITEFQSIDGERRLPDWM